MVVTTAPARRPTRRPRSAPWPSWATPRATRCCRREGRQGREGRRRDRPRRHHDPRGAHRAAALAHRDDRRLRPREPEHRGASSRAARAPSSRRRSRPAACSGLSLISPIAGQLVEDLLEPVEGPRDHGARHHADRAGRAPGVAAGARRPRARGRARRRGAPLRRAQRARSCRRATASSSSAPCRQGSDVHAVVITEPGGPEVLQWQEVADPVAGVRRGARARRSLGGQPRGSPSAPRALPAAARRFGVPGAGVQRHGRGAGRRRRGMAGRRRAAPRC